MYHEEHALPAFIGQNATVKLWDLASEAGVRPLGRVRVTAGPGADPTHADPATTRIRWVGGLAFRPSARELATAGTNHTIAIWDTATGRQARELTEGPGATIAVAYDHQGNRLAAAGTDRNFRLPTANDGQFNSGTHQPAPSWVAYPATLVRSTHWCSALTVPVSPPAAPTRSYGSGTWQPRKCVSLFAPTQTRSSALHSARTEPDWLRPARTARFGSGMPALAD
jgi:WD40 repeat protein